MTDLPKPMTEEELKALEARPVGDTQKLCREVRRQKYHNEALVNSLAAGQEETAEDMDTIARLESEAAYAKQRVADELSRLTLKIAVAHSEAAAMRAALNACREMSPDGVGVDCIFCGRVSAHDEDCKLVSALDGTAGKEALEWNVKMVERREAAVANGWTMPDPPAWLKEVRNNRTT